MFMSQEVRENRGHYIPRGKCLYCVAGKMFRTRLSAFEEGLRNIWRHPDLLSYSIDQCAESAASLKALKVRLYLKCLSHCCSRATMFTSSTNSAVLRFTSDLSETSTGFRAEWSVFRLLHGCSNLTVTSPSGIVQFPDFRADPQAVYVGPLDCHAVVVAPGKKRENRGPLICK